MPWGLSVSTLDEAVEAFHAERFGAVSLVTPAQIRSAIAAARSAGLGGVLTPEFLFEEWAELVDAWNVIDADAYAAIPRVGRRTRLGPLQREAGWGVFSFIRERLADQRLITWSQLYAQVSAAITGGESFGYSHVVVDEAQDLSVAQVRLLAAIGQARGDALFLAGDAGQRIFHLPFSWARLGLEVRGRSTCLKVNYRTSHQIRAAADRLLPPAIADMDGVEEGRRGTVSVFDGPMPELVLTADEKEERAAVAAFLQKRLSEGIKPNEIGLLVRGEGQLPRARATASLAGLSADSGLTIAAMHGAKGLEFRAVAVMACDEDVLPDPARLASIGDMAELEAAFETERHLLYVACTRARDHLMVSGVRPGSEFLEDLGLEDQQ